MCPMMGTECSLLWGVFMLLFLPFFVSGVSFNVKIKTGSRTFAGTFANVRIDVEGTTGNANAVYLGDDFGDGDTSYKNVNINVGRINRIIVYHDNSGFNPGWYLDYITMYDRSAALWYTFECYCWVKHGDRRTINSKECHYNVPITNCLSTPVRVECHIGRCPRCRDGYFIDRHSCSSCGSIPDCSTTLCRSRSDRWCTRCRDADLFKLDNGGRSCARTCSWEDRWCWPGTCGGPDTHNYARNCTCGSTNFRRVYDSTQVKCELTKVPEIVACRLKIIDQYNDERMSLVPAGQPNVCSNQQDFYGNIQVKKIDTETKFDLLVDVTHLYSQKPHFVTDYAFGVTDVNFHFVKKSLTGSEMITTFSIKEDTDSTNPLSVVSYDRVMNNSVRNGDMENGQRLCLRLEVHGGGHFVSRNVQTHATYSVPYPKTSSTRELCYWYDDAPPEHCLEHSSCDTEPLDTTSRILTNLDFTVTFGGWDDPSPVPGDTKFASGIHTYVVNLYEVKESGPDFLDVGRTPVMRPVEEDNLTQINISIPSNLPNPAMYAIVLEVTDVANNVRQARRFVMFDNSSKVVARDDKPFFSTTASQKTNYKWQTNFEQICYSWSDKYYNDKFHSFNLLKPIRDDPHGLISGVYEQSTGILPVSGSENIHGITRFYYTLKREGQIVNKTNVPDFTSQTLCVSPKLTDGDTYRLDLVAEDFLNRTYSDSLVTYIDASGPEIFNVWLVREGYERLYVHYSTDLSKMILAFKSLDVHSGIYSVDWSLGTAFGVNDIGQGSIDVLTANTNITCLDGVDPCYCPYVGDCTYYNFTLNLNSRLHSNASIGSHNHKYHFTITVTNIARLVYVEHLEILADDSPPAPGIVIEGMAGSPDIDYTSDEEITVTWAGFIDHESGIKLYKVGLSTECLKITDINHDTFIEETTLTSANFSLPEDGKYYVTVVAYNNAMEPSTPVCSDGVILERLEKRQQTAISSGCVRTIVCNESYVKLIIVLEFVLLTLRVII